MIKFFVLASIALLALMATTLGQSDEEFCQRVRACPVSPPCKGLHQECKNDMDCCGSPVNTMSGIVQCPTSGPGSGTCCVPKGSGLMKASDAVDSCCSKALDNTKCNEFGNCPCA